MNLAAWRTQARHMLCFGVSPHSLTFIFGNHAEAQSGEYLLEDHRHKQPASKPAPQKKTEGWVGHVPSRLLVPNPGCSTQMGLSVPVTVQSVGTPCSLSARVQGVGASPGFGAVQRDGFSSFLNSNGGLHTRQDVHW